ncbi:diguanylate cyclase [Sphingomonas sp. SUN019]|uniref:sensor domain-containing protein n=1 Tax=Sphingomonas sp. SUN019 TaxID=2937788 RepID=UPI0021649B5A|nr:diguanylate cyclase [Sphingomonas sp. SUN019]UVO52279.1 diguanylate cyclase [Sphingomonas sp. SUN019]
MAVARSPIIDETNRLEALRALGDLTDGTGAEFSALVAMAARFVDCPIAMLNLVDRDAQRTVAGHGIELSELPRTVAFCNHTVRKRDLMVVPDAREDVRFQMNPLVTGDGLRFYAGMPVHAPDADGTRQPIGAICVVDTEPRQLSPAAAEALRHLATVAEALIAARGAANESKRQAERMARQERVLLQAERMAMIGSWRLPLGTDHVEWSDNVYRIHGLEMGDQPALSEALDFYPPHARAIVSGALAQLIDEEQPLDIETDFVTARGEFRRVRSIAELERNDGQPIAIVGIVQDVTDRYTMEQALRRSAELDDLTGIANRAVFNRTLETEITIAQRDGLPLLLALVDLDGFKAINDTLGHLAGDDVLKAVGRRLEQPWLKGSVAARLGGDEFALIVTDPALASSPAAFVRRLEAALAVPVTANGLTIMTAGTVGVALVSPDTANIRDMIHRADTALYAAKRARVGLDRRVMERRAS